MSPDAPGRRQHALSLPSTATSGVRVGSVHSKTVPTRRRPGVHHRMATIRRCVSPAKPALCVSVQAPITRRSCAVSRHHSATAHRRAGARREVGQNLRMSARRHATSTRRPGWYKITLKCSGPPPSTWMRRYLRARAPARFPQPALSRSSLAQLACISSSARQHGGHLTLPEARSLFS